MYILVVRVTVKDMDYTLYIDPYTNNFCIPRKQHSRRHVRSLVGCHRFSSLQGCNSAMMLNTFKHNGS